MVYTLSKLDEKSRAGIAEEKKVRGTNEMFLLFSLGSQFDHLIKQALEKLGVFCLVADSAGIGADEVKEINPTGIILSGGPVSVYENPPPFDNGIFDLGIPVLGICLGFQLWAQHIGCKVVRAKKREFGVHELRVIDSYAACTIFLKCPQSMPVLESHGDQVLKTAWIQVSASTDNADLAAAQRNHLWGVQFHPEVTETTYGQQIFENFCFIICGAKDRFPAQKIAERKVSALREQIGDKKVLLALSGGSDSSTCAYLLKNALADQGGRLRGVYIRGIDRADDEEYVIKYFGKEDWIELKIVDATEGFLAALAGKVTMKEKRVAMRSVYKAVLEREAELFGADFIAQGTLYTDISESGGGYNIGAAKAQIKLHHNFNLGFSLPEILPLADCVKDSGRNIGRSLDVPEELLIRHPFPGPGLVVRIEGEVTAEKLNIARLVDGIYIEELRRWKLYDTVWQVGAVVTQSITTCTKGDDAVSGFIIALWAVWSVNGFTAQAAELPWDFLKVVSRRITNEVREVGAVVYRISDKPPTTIEWG